MTDLGIPKRRSVSQLTSYSSCGEAYRLERIAKAPRRPAAWFQMGTSYHKIVEDWENGGRKEDEEQLYELYSADYNAGIEAIKLEWPDLGVWMTGGSKKGEQDIADREVLGRWQVGDYVRFARENEDEWRVITSEVYFEMDFGGVPVVGYIDQIRQYKDGRIEAVDLKTGSSTPVTAVQLATYRWAVHKFMGVLPDTGAFVKAGRPATPRSKKDKPTADIRHDLTSWTKPKLDRWFVDMDRAERAGIYLPNPGEHCARTCGVAQFCSAVGHPPSAALYAPATLQEETA